MILTENAPAPQRRIRVRTGDISADLQGTAGRIPQAPTSSPGSDRAIQYAGASRLLLVLSEVVDRPPEPHRARRGRYPIRDDDTDRCGSHVPDFSPSLSHRDTPSPSRDT